ncbi:MAG: cell division protein FtsA [Firmicutes bacterium]|uniref:Cell division protein FtsA n=1 Tax=Candidatus Gallilactobacillus intestinavium TaxID=2840838 RepID=A0A9D9E470_9LACO|nr:cell division protein FtsA [Candidatus Gallilactobacillus intestinavium]
MGRTKLFGCLDIGTTTIKVIVAEYVNREMNVIGVASNRSEGLSRGVIIDIDRVAETIKKTVEEVEQKTNVHIDSIVLGIPANQLKIEPATGMISVSDNSQSREITDRDVQDVANAALMQNLPPKREVISIFANEFIVDGFDEIKDPRGMVGLRLEMRGTMYTGPQTIIHNATKAVEYAGLKVADYVVEPMAIGQTVLNDGEQDFGTVVIDVGGGQTTAAVIHDHKLKFTYVDQEAGDFITKDISVVLNTSMEDAEKIKRNYGFADSSSASDEDKFLVKVVGQDDKVQVDEKYLSEIIEARLKQIFENVKNALDKYSALDLPGGVVLTGGTSAIPGIKELAEDILETHVRIYVPEQIGLRHPEFTTSVSLITYSGKQTEIQGLVKDALMGNMVDQKKFDQEEDNRWHKKKINKEDKDKESFKVGEPLKKSASNVKDFFKNFFD